jgi:hypothetical protein
MSKDPQSSIEGNFRRLAIILTFVAIAVGMIPAFFVGHWLFFLGCIGAFIAWIWFAYLMARRMERIHGKWRWF